MDKYKAALETLAEQLFDRIFCPPGISCEVDKVDKERCVRCIIGWAKRKGTVKEDPDSLTTLIGNEECAIEPVKKGTKVVYMKAKINKDGYLSLTRRGIFRDIFCPNTTGNNLVCSDNIVRYDNTMNRCGDWCPMFKEPEWTDRNADPYYYIPLCDETIIAEEVIDERPMSPELEDELEKLEKQRHDMMNTNR